jgi:excinuclease ABC subunit A
MDKPDVDYIDGLSPAISIDQKTTSRNPRSTVGTVTEIYDYLRLLWARVGIPHCPNCGKEIKRQTIDQIVDQIMALPEGTKLQVMAPVVRARKGEYTKVFDDARRAGYVRARVDGIAYDLSEEIKLEKNKKHDIDIVVDRLVMKSDIVRRLTDSVETASALANNIVTINLPGRRQGYAFLTELRLRGLRHIHRGNDAAHVFLQQSLRRLPKVFRIWGRSCSSIRSSLCRTRS